MNDVLHFSIQDNGLYTSLPQLLKLIVSLATGAWSDWLIANDYLSITNARKIFIVIGKAKKSLFKAIREIKIFFLVFSIPNFRRVRGDGLVCAMWQINGRHLFHHIDCVPRCAWHIYQPTWLEPELCWHSDGHRHHCRWHDRHSSTVCRWRIHTTCKSSHFCPWPLPSTKKPFSFHLVIAHRMAYHFLDHIRAASAQSGRFLNLGLRRCARLERTGRREAAIAQSQSKVHVDWWPKRPLWQHPHDRRLRASVCVVRWHSLS